MNYLDRVNCSLINNISAAARYIHRSCVCVCACFFFFFFFFFFSFLFFSSSSSSSVPAVPFL